MIHSPSPPSPRVLRMALGVVLGCAGLWHALPHLVWAVHLEPQLRALPAAHRLEVSRLSLAAGEVPLGFDAVTYAGLSLQVPLGSVALSFCSGVQPICQLEIQGGRLVVHAEPPPETFWEMVRLRAPDRRDLSWWRGADFNWRAIQALRTRVSTSRSDLESWRFESSYVRGVVAETQHGETANYVVAVYAGEGSAGRILGLSNLSLPVLLQVLATIRFEPGEPL